MNTAWKKLRGARHLGMALGTLGILLLLSGEHSRPLSLCAVLAAEQAELPTQAEKTEPAPTATGKEVTPAANEGRSLSAPYMEDTTALDEGKSMFRGLCSGCHGGSARGGKGPNLTDDRWLHGDGTDVSIAGIIEKGVPGTTMKKLGESLKEEQIAKIIAHVRSLAKPEGDADWKPYMIGDAVAGKQLFLDMKSPFACNKCHALGGRGGGIGPELDRIATRRSPQYVMKSIVDPSQDIAPHYEQILVLTDSGKSLVGLRINETNFSVQLREQDGRFHSLDKRTLEKVKTLKTSIMPGNIAEMLTVKQLHDLFAFLMTLE
ncbi:MAG: c-type cytochrome [Pirellulales bacterium]|nr:c-type cytochrome [Pirellulales bacterium]